MKKFSKRLPQMVWLSLFMLPCVVGCHSHDSHTVITPATATLGPKGDDDNDHHFSKTAYRTGASVPSVSIPSWFANGLPGRIECLDDGGGQAL